MLKPGLSRQIVFIGCGGIAEHALHQINLITRMAEPRDPYRLRLVDGDAFEPRNHERQLFTFEGNKAEARAAFIKQVNATVRGCALRIEAVPKFVSDIPAQLLLDNVCHPREVIPEGSVVFCCVDNHDARRALSNHMGTLRNGVIINAGNDLEIGTATVYMRIDGVDVTPPLTMADEIKNAPPRDYTPGCDAMAIKYPQLVTTNALAAISMMSLWQTILSGKMPIHQVKFGISVKTQDTDLFGPAVRGSFFPEYPTKQGA